MYLGHTGQAGTLPVRAKGNALSGCVTSLPVTGTIIQKQKRTKREERSKITGKKEAREGKTWRGD